MDEVARFSQWLVDNGQLNFTFLYDSFDRQRLLAGIGNTLLLSLYCIVLSVVIGIAGAYAVTTRMPYVGRATEMLVRFCRNSPPLLILYLLFFGLAGFAMHATDGRMNWLLGSGFLWTTIAVPIYIGAFNIESLRAGIETVPMSLSEAALALGLTRLKTFALVVLPLGFRVALPSLTNNLVELVKTTSYGYAIGVAEVVYASSQIWADSLNVMEMMITLFVVFMVLIGLVVAGMSMLKRRLRLVTR
ncbi:Polar amino acid ABC transporter inner membrane subunit [Mesorhizobium plurifarium]|uniref:Polar amino acid ABC transporter inner membrane subunit n=1 Tax=Mesorhizobium plurifarium TaxID=69974 RepID=A0A090FJV1_MESPL|nr:Polar amino acid ABC transporter inner membrane subunit [Mesorhizobium plurifarium]